MIKEQIIKAKHGYSVFVKENSILEVVDICGGQVADFFAICDKDENEFLSTGVTIDCNESLKISTGDMIFTNRYHPMFEIIADDVGEHNLIHPCCSNEMFAHLYNNEKGHSNCLDNINNEIFKYGFSKKNSIQPFNIFMNTAIHTNGKISVLAPKSKQGDKIKLLVKMDCIVFIAACSVSQSKCNAGKCSDIKLIVHS
jgi:uncharacterized protein